MEGRTKEGRLMPSTLAMFIATCAVVALCLLIAAVVLQPRETR